MNGTLSNDKRARPQLISKQLTKTSLSSDDGIPDRKLMQMSTKTWGTASRNGSEKKSLVIILFLLFFLSKHLKFFIFNPKISKNKGVKIDTFAVLITNWER